MAKSSASTLYGVKNYNPTSLDGSLAAHPWAALRAPNSWGFFEDEQKAKIIWFNDIGARDEFDAIFGGLKVTLHRREERTFAGQQAMDLLRKAG